ncbi:4'-phosphopantetheinyl transferase family protein [Alteromonas sp. a30]|uniref:4'-phosphopantetheinyl transferase family protein n=1 Tax=Alteromonas sp. a30 TaxID=2730917 RepID=UPI00227ECEBC|nr:4'-phosphopantetheinyl transferase superfamily protein [Alteromonas sp. a30]MCY7297180.1 4'-phosphopantetheinyl transferase superfamily protein [Alteromonas sp. a30]
MTTTHLYYFPLSDLPEAFDDKSLTSVLDVRELQRFNDTLNANTRLQFVLSRWIVKHGLSRVTGLPAQAHQFSYLESGKPFIDLPRPVHFSIAHCATSVAVAISDVSVGVDVENNQRKGAPWQQLDRFFYPDLQARMLALPESMHQDFFYLHWTGMESMVKMKGSKVALERRTFAQSFELPLNENYVDAGDTHFYFRLVEQHEHLAVASEKRIDKFHLERVLLTQEGIKTAPL